MARAIFGILLAAVVLGAASAIGAAPLGLVPSGLTVFAGASTITPTSCSLAASSADAYVDGTALLSNFGAAADLLVTSSLVGNRRTLLRFDLASCGIPAGARVTSATLALVLSQAPASSRVYEVRRVTSSWSESTITWTSQPTVAGSATATATTGTSSGVTLSWDVSADAQAFVAGTSNDGWRVADSSESALVAVSGTFGSRERATAAERPTLTVSFYP